MLTVSNLTMSFGGRELFREAAFQVNRGDRCALVGANGAGKSTLFSLLLREEKPDEGEISIERGVVIGWLPQETAPAEDETVLELACGISARHSEALRALRVEPKDSERYHEADHLYRELGGYALEPKAKKILSGLAFRESDFDRSAKELSGGWGMRAHLARLLVMEPDLLLLDEPTNHLDLESLGWFEGHLKGYRGAILVISHDREFLNELVDSVFEIRNSRVSRYKGNYDNFVQERAARQEQQWAAYKNQQKEIESLQRFADRFRAKASKASQAQSKLKQIDRMEKIEAPEADAPVVKIRFPQPERAGQYPLKLENAHFAYGDFPVYRGVDFECERGDRIALVGPNGAGKSTLLKLLAGVLQLGGGELKLGHRVKVGYYSQNRGEMLDAEKTVIEEATAVERAVPELLARTVLGSFLFSGDAIYKRVSVLSGGEKSRLALVKLLLDPPNVLLMDEPTTHLDMASIDALIAAFQQFEGTLVFISHDVYFIRSLAAKVLRVSAGNFEWYPGGYDYYLDKSGSGSGRSALVAGERLADGRPQEEAVASGGRRESIFKSKEQKREEAKQRQERAMARKALEAEVHAVEREIAVSEERVRELTERLEHPSTYEAGSNVMELNRDLLELTEGLERLHIEWEVAAEKLEKAKE